MFHVISSAEQQRFPNRTVKFEGEDYGSNVSFFLIDNELEGPGPYVHPYPRHGSSAAARPSSQSPRHRRAAVGDIIARPARLPHRFENVGTGRLELVCIHASDRIIQDWVDAPA